MVEHFLYEQCALKICSSAVRVKTKSRKFRVLRQLCYNSVVLAVLRCQVTRLLRFLRLPTGRSDGLLQSFGTVLFSAQLVSVLGKNLQCLRSFVAYLLRRIFFFFWSAANHTSCFGNSDPCGAVDRRFLRIEYTDAPLVFDTNSSKRRSSFQKCSNETVRYGGM
eukprot:GHVQ01033207.1.p1 GENE.GHVQ01033207.1~~GHVQ01033207.1.p1  ORF type:complete len:164 (-),score=10.69 GHVQ01033207.1:829-1320(-)